MNLNFNALFDNKLENSSDEAIDRFYGDADRDDYQRDEMDEHYLSEYRNQEDSDQEDDSNRFSGKERYYDRHDHRRFGREEN
ncbi:MAG: hypothetical protein F6K28_31680 [Microcoleus sp. SIO2G3]|nr:hypothetical protein [Microcoleus sp. SIO2G3]